MTALTAIIISLPGAAGRRRFVGRALERVGLPYAFLDATPGKALSEEWITNNVSTELRNRLESRNHSLSYVNTVACADSHRRAQRLVASGDEGRYYLILEDDVLVNRLLVSGWPEIERALRDTARDIAFAGYSLPAGATSGTLIARATKHYALLRYPATKTLGAFGYLVTPAGAKMLLRCNDDLIRDTADNFRINELGLSDNVALISPKLISSGYLPTTIGYPGSARLGALKRALTRLPILRQIYIWRQQN
ncbi:glycosyltransferase family 25 protein [Salinisphaera japonica]|uniref:glycosyltransferase family 25 protein n=1 Tax=Salinisphaera japonica TaxID=1304270 RepID=UPI0016171EFA|nr:glycosyltransferase family 25 protein [Salinisphaera japonica]